MTLQLTLRRAALLAAGALLGALYFADLNGVGLVSKDEPRYADIGRAMARTGDLITPRLSGQPWFEKPPLLYWMIAAGFKAGLGPELAPRLPVALLSVAFLLFFWDRIRRLYDTRVASCSTGILATSAGWAALSGVAITDVPLAVFFTAAVLMAMDRETPGHRTWSAAALALAVLAKSLVPLVLFVPVLALDYHHLREWLRPTPVAVFLAIALPWHLLCFLQNGTEFLRVLFVQQQFGRFVSPERQHPQAWWFYFPILLMMLYPWFPLLAMSGKSSRSSESINDWRDRRSRILIAVVVFGFLFFSASLNKLPTYLMPLMPCACMLMGIGLARAARPELALILPAGLLGMLPAASRALPAAIATGIRSVSISVPGVIFCCAAIAAVAAVLAIGLKNRLVPIAFIVTAGAFLWLKTAAFPALDRAASARPLWFARHPQCVGDIDRGVLYGLNYYAGRALPRCSVLDQSPTPVVR